MTDDIQSESSVMEVRREKLKKLREEGRAYPNTFRRDNFAQDLVQYADMTKEELSEKKIQVKIAGRILMRRLMGKASFVQVQDMSGRIQLYVRANEIGTEAYKDYKHWDIGDIVGCHGYLFKTKTNELSVWVEGIELLTKSLRPLPDKFHGLSDMETRYRQRYVDLIINEQSQWVFKTRVKVIAEMRKYFDSKNFMEVETPMMQVIPGGATARPFVTHHNALDMDLYLRIAPELYLKRLVVGGFERVYEINRNFRNEGLSTKHNPEFTMIEFYQAYADYKELMDLTEELLRTIVKNVLGKTTIEYQGQKFDFEKSFKRMTVLESIIDANSDLTMSIANNHTELVNYMKSHKMKVESNWGLGRCQFEVFENTVEGSLLQPTFITEHPTEISPLARRNDNNPHVTDRFEFFVGGRELANGFSELNDADDQAERFRLQVASKEQGDDEAMHYDADYIRALEYGLPPTAGEGIGIDRLVMLLTDSPSIKDVLLFPHMRPENN